LLVGVAGGAATGFLLTIIGGRTRWTTGLTYPVLTSLDTVAEQVVLAGRFIDRVTAFTVNAAVVGTWVAIGAFKIPGAAKTCGPGSVGLRRHIRHYNRTAVAGSGCVQRPHARIPGTGVFTGGRTLIGGNTPIPGGIGVSAGLTAISTTTRAAKKAG